MTTVLFPGSFDPFHNGHLEIARTAARLFGRVIVATVRNPQKGTEMFDLDERMELIASCLAGVEGVEVRSFTGLVVDLARETGSDFILKGLRTSSDFESEVQMALTNKEISGVETLFLPSAGAHSFLASRLIREVARLGGPVDTMVPGPIAERLAAGIGPRT